MHGEKSPQPAPVVGSHDGGRLGRILSVVSHDLRSPLSALNVGIDALSDPDLDQATRDRYLAAMRRAVQRAAQVLSDLVDASEESASDPDGAGVPALESVATAPLLEDVAHAHEQQARDAGSWFVIEVADGADWISAERASLLRALDKLVVNALHHGAGAGAVTLRAEPTVSDHRRRVRLWIIDHGRGQVQGAGAALPSGVWRGPEGTASGAALGMSVAQSIVEMQGGTIGLQRGAGGGARVYVELDVARAQSA